MSKWPKEPNKEKTEKMLKIAAELGLNIKDACIYAHISYLYYKQNKDWTRPAYLAGKARRSQRAIGPSLLASKILTKRQLSILEQIEKNRSKVLTSEEIEVIRLVHKMATDEYNRLDKSERRRIEWQELKLKKQLLDAKLNTCEEGNFIATASLMSEDDLNRYMADDFNSGDCTDGGGM